MFPVKKIDIRLSDLLFGFWATLFSRKMKNPIESIGFLSKRAYRTVPCFCVRTGFDRLFSILQLPKGSEVIMSAVTIGSMEKIVRHHGLVPVPVDLNPQNFAPYLQEIESKITPKTKMIVLTHLFGNYTDPSAVCELAKKHNLIVVEDCAQFPGIWQHERQASDVVMFSYGPAKAATALGGALFCIKDLELEKKFKGALAQLPTQSRSDFFSRLIRYSLVKLLGTVPIYTAIYSLCRVLNYPLQENLAKTSVFGKKDFLKEIQKQPSLPMLQLLARRISSHPNPLRNQLGSLLSNALPKRLQVGLEATSRAYLVFPIVVEDQKQWVKHLQKHKFDSVCSDNLIVIGTKKEKERMKTASHVLSHLLYVPFYPELGHKTVQKLSNCLNKASDS